MHNKGQEHGEFLRCFSKNVCSYAPGNRLLPSSERLNLVGVVSGMTGRRECVHYVAVLSTIGPGQLSLFRDSLLAGRCEDGIPAAARFFAPVQIGTLAHPALYTMGTRSFPGVNWTGSGFDHLPLQPDVNKKSKATHLLPLRTFMDGSRLKFSVTFAGYNPCNYPTQCNFSVLQLFPHTP